MLVTDLGKTGVVLQRNDPDLVEPLAEPAQVMGIAAGIPFVRRQAANQRAEYGFGPLIVIVGGLLELLQRHTHLFVGHVGNSHRCPLIPGCKPTIKSNRTQICVNILDLSHRPEAPVSAVGPSCVSLRCTTSAAVGPDADLAAPIEAEMIANFP